MRSGSFGAVQKKLRVHKKSSEVDKNMSVEPRAPTSEKSLSELNAHERKKKQESDIDFLRLASFIRNNKKKSFHNYHSAPSKENCLVNEVESAGN